MTICQMISNNCGWPLNIIMTPSKKPFFASTYIPKQSRLGHIGMLELIPKIEDKKGALETDIEEEKQQIKLHEQKVQEKQGKVDEIDKLIPKLETNREKIHKNIQQQKEEISRLEVKIEQIKEMKKFLG